MRCYVRASSTIRGPSPAFSRPLRCCCTSALSATVRRATAPFHARGALCARRYTGEADVVVGSSSSTFNPLILRIRFTPDTTLGELVRLTQRAEEDATQHEVPFEQLRAMVQQADQQHQEQQQQQQHGADASNLASRPLFAARFFNVVDVAQRTLEAAACDWTVYVEQLPDTKRLLPLNLRVIYNTVLFSRERMEEMLRQLEQTTRCIAAQPTCTVRHASVLTPHARAVLPDPRAPLSDAWHGAIHEHFQRRAEQHPDRVLAVQGTTPYTYGALNGLSNRIAQHLLARGVRPEDVVVLFAHRSVAMLAVVMGILKAGATVSVIDPAYPPPRQIIYLSVARPRAIVSLRRAGAIAAEVRRYIDAELRVVCELPDVEVPDEARPTGGQLAPPLAAASDAYPAVTVGPDSVGTLSFTSGSTGIPKAVRGRHISLTHFYPWMGTEFGLSAEDRFTMLSGIAHDPIQRDIFTPIFFGASLHIPSAEDISSLGQLAVWMQQHRCTVTHLTPAMGQLLTANASTQMPHLRNAFFVGDVLTRRDVMRLQALAPHATVINMYGTTETQRAVSYLAIRPDTSLETRKEILPSGRGMRDVQLLVLDESGTAMAGVGELGELYVRSPHLAQGYLGLPEQTAQKFLVNPFSGLAGDRLYRTGDLGRYMPDGIVECSGRADDQVKIRGFRIELGEIDAYLAQHAHVRENITLLRRDANEEKHIVSYIVPAHDPPDVPAIRAFLATKLPAYAIPSFIAVLQRMPLTPNGKIDRNRLPFPDAALLAGRMRDEDMTGCTPLQRTLLHIWATVLGRAVRLDDNFFNVGGHSILATRLTFEMRQALGLELPLNLLYVSPTVRQIARVIEALQQQTLAAPEQPAVDLRRDAVLDADIGTAGRAPYRPLDREQVRAVFVSGVTGFLGGFLLVELLRSFPNAQLVCLVRDTSPEGAQQRLRAHLHANQLWCESAMAGRIDVVLGDLAQARFGLSANNFAALASRIDVLVHNGALVHWVYPYERLKPTNVAVYGPPAPAPPAPPERVLTPRRAIGLRTLLSTSGHRGDAAARVRRRPRSADALDQQHERLRLAALHDDDERGLYRLPAAAAPGGPTRRCADTDRAKMVLEDAPVLGESGLTVGYAQSKWVAEQLVRLAGGRGVPVSIFRPGYIIGHSETGVTNVDDYLVRLVKGCIQLGRAPIMMNLVRAPAAAPEPQFRARLTRARAHAHGAVRGGMNVCTHLSLSRCHRRRRGA